MNHFNEKLIRIDDQNQLIEFLRAPTVEFAEGLTAIMSKPGSVALVAGRLVQAALKSRLYEQLGKELEELKKSGRIKEDYFATHNQQATLHELLKFIDENPPDEEVFKALKSIFYCGVEKGASAKDEMKAYQFLQICTQLRSGDVFLLKACWGLYQEDPKFLEKQMGVSGVSLNDWLNLMNSRTGLPHGLIAVHEKQLVNLNLLTQGGPGSVHVTDCRLSSFGIELCRYITKY